MSAPTRRGLLGAGGLALAAGLYGGLAGAIVEHSRDGALAAPPSSDAELLRLFAELRAADDWLTAYDTGPGPWDEAACDVADNVWWDCLDGISALVPRTPEGARAQAGAAFLALVRRANVAVEATVWDQADATDQVVLATLRHAAGEHAEETIARLGAKWGGA